MADNASTDDKAAEQSLTGPTQTARDDAPGKVERLRMYLPAKDKYVAVALHDVEKAKSRGLEPAWEPWESALAGVGQGASLGFGDELTGAAKAGAQALGDGTTEGFAEHYKQNRDDARDKLAQAHGQNPGSYFGGQLVGGLASAVAAPGGLVGQIGVGAAQGLGNSNADNVKDLAKDTAIGAGIGAAGYGVGKAVGAAANAAAPALKNVAGKALLSGAGIGAKDLGVETQHAANALGARALEEPGLVPPVFSRTGATAQNLAENAAKTTRNAGAEMGNVHEAFDAAHGPTIGARGLAEDIQKASGEAVRVKPEMARHVARAIRQVDPEAFDAQLAKLVKERHVAGLRVHRLVEAAKSDPTVTPQIVAQVKRASVKANEALQAFKENPATAFTHDHTLTLAQTQDVVNRIRKLGAYPHGSMPSASELTVKNDILSPSWDAGAHAIRSTTEQVGGPEAHAAEQAARNRFAMNTAIKSGAEAAASRQNRIPHGIVPEGAAAAGRAAVGSLVNPAVGAAYAAAKPVMEHAIAPRMARTIHNAANVLPGVGEHTSKLLGTFGNLFNSHPPEKRVMLDHKLQEMSPRFRAARSKANREADDKAKNK